MIERTAAEFRQLFASGEISATDIVQVFLDAIRQRDPRIKAFLHVDDTGAIVRARVVDGKRSRGETLGPLAGVPAALKDVLCVRAQPATCGSKILRNFVPPYDAHVVARLRQADAILVGKTNMDEFAMGSS